MVGMAGDPAAPTPAARFLELLAAHGIGAIADVRRYPASRRHPHFAREALAAALRAGGHTYLWLEDLGGRRSARADSPHVAWRNAAFRAYADHMETPEFATALARLIEGTLPVDDWVALVRAKQPPPARFGRPSTWWTRLRAWFARHFGGRRLDSPEQ